MTSLQLLGKLAGGRGCALRIFSNGGSGGGVGGTTQLAALINYPVNTNQTKSFIHTQKWDNSQVVDRDTKKESADQLRRRTWTTAGALVPVRNASSSQTAGIIN